jgi:hypothetical protein
MSAPLRNTSVILLTVAALTAGCTGQIGNGAGAAPGASSNSGSPPATPAIAAMADEYFPSTSDVPAPKRMVRLSRTQLDLTASTLLPKLALPSATATIPSDPLQTNYEYADNLGFNPANFTPFTSWVSAIATAVKAAPQAVIDCTASNNATTCLTDKAKAFVRSAFRGTPTDAQLGRFADFFTASVAAVGLPAATADLVDVTLTSPNFAFRDEVLADSSGLLQPAQHLQQITYTLADAPPDRLGLSSATPSNYLASAAATQKTIDQVLASPEARDKLMRFFLAWLEVKEPDQFNIATSTFPEFTPAVAAAVVDETKAFLTRQLGKAAPKMTDLTDTTQSLVGSAEAFLYGMSPPAAPTMLDLDPTQRLGIFTLPGVIASHSGPTTTRLVKRGVFFVRKVMCIPMGNPPQGVDTTLPTTTGATERQKIESVTAQAPCSGCHGVINPFGFMQESFDAIGRWRTTDSGQPIDASVSVDFLDEGPMMTSSPIEALRTFTHSWRFQQCFARQLFRFYTGRDETSGDDPVLHQMLVDFANGGEDIVAMLRTLASAANFSRRAEVQ